MRWAGRGRCTGGAGRRRGSGIRVPGCASASERADRWLPLAGACWGARRGGAAHEGCGAARRRCWRCWCCWRWSGWSPYSGRSAGPGRPSREFGAPRAPAGATRSCRGRRCRRTLWARTARRCGCSWKARSCGCRRRACGCTRSTSTLATASLCTAAYRSAGTHCESAGGRRNPPGGGWGRGGPQASVPTSLK